MRLRVPYSSTSIELNMWNPLYPLAPIALLLFSIPLAMFAAVTTGIALTILFLRASVVYVQLAAALVGAWISPTPPLQTSTMPSKHSPKRTSPRSQRHRRSTTASAASSQETIRGRPPFDSSESFTALIGTTDMTRDFEGVGGWRVAGDDEEEALWMGLNSRFAPPAESPVRHHRRSQTGGPAPGHRPTWSSEATRTSPVQSRSRTPVRFVDDDEDYFPAQPMPTLRPLSSVSDLGKHHGRAKSCGGGSSARMASREGGP